MEKQAQTLSLNRSGYCASLLVLSAYHKALADELRKAGLRVECGKPITVLYNGVAVGEVPAALLLEDRVMLELTTNQALAPANEAQFVNDPTATGIEIALLPNFGAARPEFKRKTRTYRPKNKGRDEQDLQDFKL